MKLNKLILEIGEGKRRLRILISSIIVIISYALIYQNAWNPSNDDVFIAFPLGALMCGAVGFLFVTCVYWVIDGFFPDSQNELRNPNAPKKEFDPDSYSTQFIRNVGNSFDAFCRKKQYTQLFDYKGPFFAWSLLWMAIRNTPNYKEELRDITVRSLHRVLKVNHQHAVHSIDGHMKNALGKGSQSFSETGKLLGIDYESLISESHNVMIERLEEAITQSLDRINSGEENKYVPVLNILMGRNSDGDSKFKDMTDNEFEYLFLEIVSEKQFNAKNMANKLTTEMLKMGG